MERTVERLIHWYHIKYECMCGTCGRRQGSADVLALNIEVAAEGFRQSYGYPIRIIGVFNHGTFDDYIQEFVEAPAKKAKEIGPPW